VGVRHPRDRLHAYIPFLKKDFRLRVFCPWLGLGGPAAGQALNQRVRLKAAQGSSKSVNCSFRGHIPGTLAPGGQI